MSSHVLEHLAKEKGFVQRKSKYQAQELVVLCVWLSQQVASTSLARNYVAVLKYQQMFL
ncbi:Transposase [Bacillus cereus BDRD-ST196]|nr:Transposase [Bacillus cereus BDRD-ST196]